MIRSLIKLVCLLSVALFVLTGLANAQRAEGVAGRWVWKQVARNNRPQTQFTLVINRDGNIVRGVYSVDEFINGEWQGEDGNQTPFIGRVTGARVEIEFDPDATVPGYQENVTYQPPTDGRKPGGAVLTLKDATLQWHLILGRIEGVPTRAVLRRERRPK